MQYERLLPSRRTYPWLKHLVEGDFAAGLAIRRHCVGYLSEKPEWPMPWPSPNQSPDARLPSRSFFSAPVNHQIRLRVLRSCRSVASLRPCTHGVCLYIASSLCPVYAHPASIQWYSDFEVDNGSQPL